MGDILFLGKKVIKDKYYFQVYFFGAVKLIPVSQEDYEMCETQTGQKLDFEQFNMTCYNKGFDTVVSLKLK